MIWRKPKKPSTPRVLKKSFFRLTSGRNPKSTHQVQGWIQTFFPKFKRISRTNQSYFSDSIYRKFWFSEQFRVEIEKSIFSEGHRSRQTDQLTLWKIRLCVFDAILLRKIGHFGELAVNYQNSKMNFWKTSGKKSESNFKGNFEPNRWQFHNIILWCRISSSTNHQMVYQWQRNPWQCQWNLFLWQ